jgi:hypothetical protein
VKKCNAWLLPRPPEREAAVWPKVSLVISLPLVALAEVKLGLRACGPRKFQQLAAQAVAARTRHDIHHASSRSTVLGRETVGEHSNLIHRHQRNIGEDRLASPHIDRVRSIGYEQGLPSSCAVGGEQIFIHEDVALVDGGAVGCVEQRQIGDAAVG